MVRSDQRSALQLRPVTIERNYVKHAEGSVLVCFGDTKVLCTATVEERVPPFRRGTGLGWVTAEYSLLPRSTHFRVMREAVKGRLSGRTQEIQRLIGRSLRGVCNFQALGERTIILDCDVIQADGGTRTAAITGAYVALADAANSVIAAEQPFLLTDFVAAVSVGLVDGHVFTDLCYQEDSQAQVDLNLVMTGSGKFIEVQGTGEDSTYTRAELNSMLEAGESAIKQLIAYQQEVLGDILCKIK